MANKPTLREAAEIMGFETLNQMHLGTWQGYAVTIYPNQSYYCIHFAVRTDKKDNRLRKALLSAVKERCPKRCASCLNLGSSIAFNMKFQRKESYQTQLTDYLNAMADALRQAGVQPALTCAHCGAQNPDSLCLVGTAYQPVHASCVRNAKEDAVEKAQLNQESGSYLTGTLGAIVGTLVGLIPSVLTILFMERIYALLFALVPLAAMFGYRLCKGKRSKASIGIIIVLSIIGVLALQIIVATISVARDSSATFAETASWVVPYLLSGEGMSTLLTSGDTLVEFLFMVLGIFFAWKYIAQTNEGSVAAANAVASTLRPINTASDFETTTQV